MSLIDWSLSHTNQHSQTGRWLNMIHNVSIGPSKVDVVLDGAFGSCNNCVFYCLLHWTTTKNCWRYQTDNMSMSLPSRWQLLTIHMDVQCDHVISSDIVIQSITVTFKRPWKPWDIQKLTNLVQLVGKSCQNRVSWLVERGLDCGYVYIVTRRPLSSCDQ